MKRNHSPRGHRTCASTVHPPSPLPSPHLRLDTEDVLAGQQREARVELLVGQWEGRGAPGTRLAPAAASPPPTHLQRAQEAQAWRWQSVPISRLPAAPLQQQERRRGGQEGADQGRQRCLECGLRAQDCNEARHVRLREGGEKGVGVGCAREHAAAPPPIPGRKGGHARQAQPLSLGAPRQQQQQKSQRQPPPPPLLLRQALRGTSATRAVPPPPHPAATAAAPGAAAAAARACPRKEPPRSSPWSRGLQGQGGAGSLTGTQCHGQRVVGSSSREAVGCEIGGQEASHDRRPHFRSPSPPSHITTPAHALSWSASLKRTMGVKATRAPPRDGPPNSRERLCDAPIASEDGGGGGDAHESKQRTISRSKTILQAPCRQSQQRAEQPGCGSPYTHLRMTRRAGGDPRSSSRPTSR